MNKKVIIKLELELNDRNRNFNEILCSIYGVINQRDGVESSKLLEEYEIEKNK